jgi:bacillithiol system protein YtxJ
MEWNTLHRIDQLNDLIRESSENKILIFKHSTRCNISRSTLDRLERNWNDRETSDVKAYFLDLLSNRDLSNRIAEQFGVEHQSPQVLIISQGKSVYDRSHFQIDFQDITKFLKN